MQRGSFRAAILLVGVTPAMTAELALTNSEGTGLEQVADEAPVTILHLQAPMAHLALPASRPRHPGLGPQCSGMWTELWADREALAKMRLHVEAPLFEALERHQCPYGRALPGDVTWPSPPPELEDLVAPLDMLKLVAVGYAYLPYLLAAHAMLAFVVQRGTRQLGVLLWLLLMVSFSELILKKVWREPRPGTMLQVKDFAGNYVGSCLRSCGMPSSHSALAIGWFVILFLDAMYRSHPFALGDKTQTMPLRPDVGGGAKAITCLKLYLSVPWADNELLTHTQFVVYISAWFVLLVPVPFMRVVLYDHTFVQVVTGSFVGAVLAVVWWRVTRYFQRKYQHLEGKMIFPRLLLHNFKIAKFHVSGSGDITAGCSP